MPALASLEDVKRILRLTDSDATRDARLRAALAAVESWAETRLFNVSRSGLQVEVYYDVLEDASLQLPASDVTVTLVKVYEYPSSSGVLLSPVTLGLGRGYEVTDDARLLLRPTLGVTPFEGATAQRHLRVYARVEVYYQGTGHVPPAVSEGIAFLAAGYYTDGPRALRGLMSEKIGDYSYTLGGVRGAGGGGTGGDEPSYVPQARFFLEPFLKRQHVMVT